MKELPSAKKCYFGCDERFWIFAEPLKDGQNRPVLCRAHYGKYRVWLKDHEKVAWPGRLSAFAAAVLDGATGEGQAPVPVKCVCGSENALIAYVPNALGLGQAAGLCALCKLSWKSALESECGRGIDVCDMDPATVATIFAQWQELERATNVTPIDVDAPVQPADTSKCPCCPHAMHLGRCPAKRGRGTCKCDSEQISAEGWPLNGALCAVCNEPQRATPHGAICSDPRHGGAPGVAPSASRPTPEVKDTAIAANLLNGTANESVEVVPFSAMPPKLQSQLKELGVIDAEQEVIEQSVTVQSTKALLQELDSIEAELPSMLAFNQDAHKLTPLLSSDCSEWGTDPETFAWLDAWAEARWGSRFVHDVCASESNRKCDSFYSKEDSCFDHPEWPSPWFMNNPYGEPELPCKKPDSCKKKKCAKRGYHADSYVPGGIDFMKWARAQGENGCPGMCLVPFRPDTEWWQTTVLAAPDGAEQVELGGDWAQGWTWVKWSNGLLVEVRIIAGREDFVHPERDDTTTAPFPSVVVVFDRWE